MPVDDFDPQPLPPREERAPRTRVAQPAPRARHRVRSGALISVTVVALLFLSLAAYGAWRWSSVARTDVALDQPLEGEPENWLVVGSDSRDPIDESSTNASAFLGGDDFAGGQRSDTIVIVRIDPESEQVHLVSLPRDLWVPIARTGERERINTAYSYTDGPQRLVDTIRDDFGIDIHHYAEIDFAGFQAIVDAVDGVPMDFQMPVRDPASGLLVDQEGCRVLTGSEALAFARSRHLEHQGRSGWQEDPSGDLGRIARQQQFMLAVFDRAADRIRGADLGAVNGLTGAVVDHVTLDSALDTGRAVSVARRFASLGPDSVVTHSLPVVSYSTPGGASVLRLDQDHAQRVLNTFRGLGDEALPADQVVLAMSVGTGQSAAATAAERELVAYGFRVTGDSSAGVEVSDTEIRYAPDNQRLAAELARHVDPMPRLVEDRSYQDGRMILVVGDDFVGVRDDRERR